MPSRDRAERTRRQDRNRETTVEIDISIPDSDRKYLAGIREWLEDSRNNKDIVVSGPIPAGSSGR